MNGRTEAAKERLTQRGELIPCPIWGSPYEARRIPDFFSDIPGYYSPRAGGVFHAENIDDHQYFVSQKHESKATRIKISRWVYDKNRLGEIGRLTPDEIERIEKQERLGIDQRMERLLRCFATIPSQVSRRLSHRGEYWDRHELHIVEAATECSTVAYIMLMEEELGWLISAADKSGWLERYNSHTSDARSGEAIGRTGNQGRQLRTDVCCDVVR